MSVSFTFRNFLFGVFLLAFSGSLFSQNGSAGPYTPIQTVKNEAIVFTVQSSSPPYTMDQPAHGSVIAAYVSSSTYQVTYTPNQSFVGLDTFQLEYVLFGVPPVSYYQAYRISVQNSILTVQRDFANTTVGQAITFNVLANDATTHSSGLTLSALPLKNHGTATFQPNGDVTFTPDAGFSGIAHLNYLTCDGLSSCETGSSEILVSPAPSPVSDSVTVATAKNAAISFALSHDGYSVYAAPAHGTVQMHGGFMVEYMPNSNFVGTDNFRLVKDVNGSLIFKTVLVTVVNAASPNKYALDDHVWTPKNMAKSVNVRDNDLGNYTISGWIPPNPAQGTISVSNSVYGFVTFTPAPNFTGVASFKYKLGSAWQNIIEIGTVYVLVGNMNPTASTFHLTTAVDQPLVINYQIPFLGFNFAATQPDNGESDYYAGFQTISLSNGQTVNGYNLLIYTPDAGFSGNDEFDLTYCVAQTGQCATIKVEVEVQEITSNPGDFCMDQCVWAGDINDDGLVNNRDLLPLGWWMGENGQTRPNAILEWYGQGAPDWDNPFNDNPVDLKHIDTDGNGQVSVEDTVAISQFYGKTHTIVPTLLSPAKGLPFVLQLANNNPPAPGDLVTVNILLGNSTNPVVNLYGLTFDATISAQIIDSLLKVGFLENSWITSTSPSLSISKNPRARRVESGLTRTNGILAHGGGKIGELEFIVVEVVDDTKQTKTSSSTMTIKAQPTYSTIGGQTFASDEITLEIPLNLDKNRAPATSVAPEDLKLSPNPAGEQIRLWLNGNNLIESAQILSVTGQLMWASGAMETKTTEISVSYLPNGAYFLKAETAAGPLTKKFEVLKTDR